MEEKGFITNLREENFSLDATYWLYFAIGGSILFYAFTVFPLLFLIYIPYIVICLVPKKYDKRRKKRVYTRSLVF